MGTGLGGQVFRYKAEGGSGCGRGGQVQGHRATQGCGCGAIAEGGCCWDNQAHRNRHDWVGCCGGGFARSCVVVSPLRD